MNLQPIREFFGGVFNRAAVVTNQTSSLVKVSQTLTRTHELMKEIMGAKNETVFRTQPYVRTYGEFADTEYALSLFSDLGGLADWTKLGIRDRVGTLSGIIAELTCWVPFLKNLGLIDPSAVSQKIGNVSVLDTVGLAGVVISCGCGALKAKETSEKPVEDELHEQAIAVRNAEKAASKAMYQSLLVASIYYGVTLTSLYKNFSKGPKIALTTLGIVSAAGFGLRSAWLKSQVAVEEAKLPQRPKKEEEVKIEVKLEDRAVGQDQSINIIVDESEIKEEQPLEDGKLNNDNGSKVDQPKVTVWTSTKHYISTVWSSTTQYFFGTVNALERQGATPDGQDKIYKTIRGTATIYQIFREIRGLEASATAGQAASAMSTVSDVINGFIALGRFNTLNPYNPDTKSVYNTFDKKSLYSWAKAISAVAYGDNKACVAAALGTKKGLVQYGYELGSQLFVGYSDTLSHKRVLTWLEEGKNWTTTIGATASLYVKIIDHGTKGKDKWECKVAILGDTQKIVLSQYKKFVEPYVIKPIVGKLLPEKYQVISKSFLPLLSLATAITLWYKNDYSNRIKEAKRQETRKYYNLAA